MTMDRRLVIGVGVGALLLLVIVTASLLTGSSECSHNSDCPEELTCLKNVCTKPCPGPCGTNTNCRVRNHSPVCSCKPGFSGHPYRRCLPDPVVECTSDNNCAAQLICSSQRCVDPCPISCGLNTSCIVKHHRASCSCKPGLVGDPFERCIDPIEGVKMYQLYEDKLTWFEAFEACRRHDMQLVSIESVEEQEHLVELIKLNGTEVQNWWTSGAEIGGDFIWISTGFGVDYTNWRAGEPSRHRISRPYQRDEIEGCIEIAGVWEYRWNDVVCSRMNAYICKA